MEHILKEWQYIIANTPNNLGFCHTFKVVILAWYYYRTMPTIRATNIKKIDINSNLHYGVKIVEIGNHVRVTMKVPPFTKFGTTT